MVVLEPLIATNPGRPTGLPTCRRPLIIPLIRAIPPFRSLRERNPLPIVTHYPRAEPPAQRHALPAGLPTAVRQS